MPDEFICVTQTLALGVHGGIEVAQAFEGGWVGHVGARVLAGPGAEEMSRPWREWWVRKQAREAPAGPAPIMR